MRLEDLHENGTFASLKLDEPSKDVISYLSELLEVHNPIHKDDYHTTLIYSRKPCPDAVEHHGKEIQLNGIIDNLIKWPSKSGTTCLVASVNSDELIKLNRHFTTKYGATSDYPEYKPHITLSYDCDDKEYCLPDIIPIKFTTIHVESLKEE